MATAYFPAILERGPEGFGVYFPDLPGCVSAGATMQETARNAEEALSLHLAGMAEDGEAIPQPSELDSIARDSEVDEVGRILVRADLPGRKIRVQVTLDEGLVSAIDLVAKNRSAFLEDAARLRLRAAA